MDVNAVTFRKSPGRSGRAFAKITVPALFALSWLTPCRALQPESWTSALEAWSEQYRQLEVDGYAVNVKAVYPPGDDVFEDSRTIRSKKGEYSLDMNWEAQGENKSIAFVSNASYFADVERSNLGENRNWSLTGIVFNDGPNGVYDERMNDSKGSNYFERVISGHGLLPYLANPYCKLEGMNLEAGRVTFNLKFTEAKVPHYRIPGQSYTLPKTAHIVFSDSSKFPVSIIAEWPNQWFGAVAEHPDDLGVFEKCDVFSSKASDDLMQGPVVTYWVSNLRPLQPDDRKFFTLEPFGIREPTRPEKPRPIWLWAIVGGCCLLVLSVVVKKLWV